jgi:hypothetical protein
MSGEPSETATPDGVLSAEELAAVDFDGILENPAAIDVYDHSARFNRAAEAAQQSNDLTRFRAFKLMGAICSMALDADNGVEPYRARLIIEGKRSLIPSDLSPEEIEALAAVAETIRSDALRARVADVCWLANRRVATMAELAVTSFAAALRSHLRDDPDGDPDAIGILQRALMIQRMVGWDKPAAEDLRNLVIEMRTAALSVERGFMFRDLADLDAQYDISPAADLASSAETLAKSLAAAGNCTASHELWLTAARFQNRAGNRDDANRCVVEAAEQLVKYAERGEPGFFQAHWLDRAIAVLKKIKGTSARRKELQARLLQAQADIVDHVAVVEHKTDVTDLVAAARDAVANLPLIDALLALAALSSSPDPEELREEQRKLSRQFILSSLFATTIHSHDGRKTATIPGLESGKEEALRGKIVQSEQHRRRLIATALEHARFQLTLEHSPTLSFLMQLAAVSPLVPPGHELAVAKGMASYLAGDHLTALHLLMPQLEAGLRYALAVQGEEVVIIRPDGTQEMAKLGDLLGKLRPSLVNLLNERIVFEIENLFARPEGPKLRPNVAHGLLPDHALTSSESVYACWFIYRLVLLPFIGRREKLAEHLIGAQGAVSDA